MSKSLPLVSIITANYNGENYISETINSILAQTYTNWELFIIDDSSDDNSLKIIKDFIQGSEKVHLIANDLNLGAAKTRNKGIEKAKGKYIAFLDGDDLWKPDKLKKQVRFMENENISFSFTDYDRIDDLGNFIEVVRLSQSVLSYEDLLEENKIGCLTAVYNQSSLGKVYMPNLRKRQDYAMWLKILKYTKAYKLDESLAEYRIRENSISKNKVEMLKWNFLMFYRIEQFSLLKSFYFVFRNILTKLRKG